MEDSISRQAAIDAIKERMENYRNDDCEWAMNAYNGAIECLGSIKALPSAQPEIIRCKDCGKREVCRTSTVWAVAPGDDWFCADAERRTDG